VAKARSISAGRGLILITGAKLWFMVAGYVIQFALPRALGSPALYGVYGVILNFLNPVNNVINTGTIQGVSKFTAETEERRPAVTRAALRLQAWVGGGAALGFFLLAPAFAWLEHDHALIPYYRVAAGVVLAYSFYAVFVGAANGAKQFHKQAGLDVTFSTMRCIFIVGVAAVTHSVLAALGAFVAAAATILVVAVFLVGLGGTPHEPFPVSKLVKFFGGVWFYLAISNLLMFVDGILVKRLVTEDAIGHQLANAALIANEQSGFYLAVQNVARIPYQLILAVTFIIFPLVSQSTFEADHEKTRGYVRTTMRYSLAVAALFAAVLAARPTATMRLLYKPEYVVGAPALVPLVAGYVLFSLFTIAGTIINSSGRTLPTTLIGVITLAAAAAGNWLAIHFALSMGHDPLLAAASATAAAMGFGLILAGLYLQRVFGAFVPLLTVVRVSLCCAAAAAVGWAWTRSGIMPGKFGTMISAATCGLAFVAVAVVSGELRPRELMQARRGTK
jgi:O-antigen/teichoic acid export membrane protein